MAIKAKAGVVKRPLSSTLRAPLARKTPATGRASSVERSAADAKAKEEAKQGGRKDLASLIDAFLTASSKGEDSKALEARLDELRKAVLFQGLPDELKTRKGDGFTVRGRLWKIMLGPEKVDVAEYVQLLEKKEAVQYGKIRSDSFRTFPTDLDFRQSVHEQEIVRCLNTFVHKYYPHMVYCQGMNTICAPFLYTMPEVDAFYAFSKMITRKFPLYWVSAHIGVQAGCKLVGECLEVVDRELADHLTAHSLDPYIYAFACVSSLCASVPPFNELLKLWDFLLTFGTHHIIILVVAQIVAQRTELLSSESPKDILDPRRWPSLRARYNIAVAMSLLPKIPAELNRRILLHATDTAVCEEILSKAVGGRKVDWKGLPPHLL